MENRKEEVKVLIGGDLCKDGKGSTESGGRKGRRRGKRKSKKINGEGKKLCIYLKELRLSTLNGSGEGDKEREWTYTGRKRGSVIDYVLGNKRQGRR